MRVLAVLLLSCVAVRVAGAQEVMKPPTAEQFVAIEIGQCVIQRSTLAVEVTELRARVKMLESQLQAQSGQSGRKE